MRIILASQSPRRRALLAQMGIAEFDIIPAKGEEIADPGLSPGALVETLSRRKAEEVAAQAGPDDIIVAADTVVAADEAALGKPRDTDDARRMLRALSGRSHTVYTGVTVCRGDTLLTEHEATQVTFRPLTDREIDAYAATGEPMDKAGAYGIQGLGCVLVERISGNYHNVVGLPTCLLARMLGQVGIDVLARGQEEGP